MPRFFSCLLVSAWVLTQAAAAQPHSPAQRYTQAPDRVTITMADGQLLLRPLAENAIRFFG